MRDWLPGILPACRPRPSAGLSLSSVHADECSNLRDSCRPAGRLE